jgi:hypothetical protein
VRPFELRKPNVEHLIFKRLSSLIPCTISQNLSHNAGFAGTIDQQACSSISLSKSHDFMGPRWAVMASLSMGSN